MYVIKNIEQLPNFTIHVIHKMADQDKFIGNFENMIYRLFLYSSHTKNIYSSICSVFP